MAVCLFNCKHFKFHCPLVYEAEKSFIYKTINTLIYKTINIKVLVKNKQESKACRIYKTHKLAV